MSRKGFRLPPSKLTLRPAGKKKKVKYLYDGIPELGNSTSNVATSTATAATSSASGQATLESSVTNFCERELTAYEIESRASTSSWESIRKGLLDVVVETAATSPDQPCVICEAPAFLRCSSCGPFGYYCILCFERCHQKVNFLHVAEKWEVDHYVPYVREDIKVDVRPQHACSNKRVTRILCIDENGKEVNVLFTSCECEPLTITLVRAELWPATPSNPRCAFSFSLLNRAEGLLVEAHVSLQDFCNSLSYQWHFPEFKRKDVYSKLINSFEEYRFMCHKLRNMKHVSDDLDIGSVCPACPKDGGKTILSMDALFGLPRKKSAGSSYREPLLKDVFFYDQSEVDTFVLENECTKPNQTSCSNFAAGNVLRSAKRYRALDETAVFGYCCRHDFPGKFINLKHGEKLAYGVFMLERITKQRNSEVFVIYDIACSLVAHLKKVGRLDILESTSISLPTFHCYGHKLSCQLKYSPRRCTGIGLSDGEGMERIWSYLRRFCRMTKEMRPSHRIDILSGALEYYVILKKKGLATILLKRWDRCKKVHVLAEESLHDLMPDYSADKEDDIVRWMEDEMKITSDHPVPHSALPQWKLSYFLNLRIFYSLRLQISSEGLSLSSTNDLSSVGEYLQDLERKHKILRWHPSDQDYKDCEKALADDRKVQLLRQLLNGSQRRAFLLQMKAKYADGQKIANKLSSQITKETRGIQSLLKEINVIEQVDPLCLAEALDPPTLTLRLQFLGMQTTELIGERREIIQAYLTFIRSSEEMELLLDDAKNVVTHYSQLRVRVAEEMDRMECTNLFSRGAKALLYRHLALVDELLQQGRRTVQVMMNSDPCPPTLLDSDSSDSDSSVDDYD